MKLGFIGFGSIANAVAQGCVADGHDIHISARSTARSAPFAQANKNVRVLDPQDIVDSADVLFLGTTAETAKAALSLLRFRADQKVISLMVGIPTETVRHLIAPARLEALMIPFPAIAQGNSPILACLGSDMINTLFAKSNTVITVESEDALNNYLAAQAILSPVIKMLHTSATWLAARSGDDVGAEQFMRLLVGGALLGKDIGTQDVLTDLIDALNTPGGLNQQLRDHMDAAGTYTATEQGLDALLQRLSTPES